MDESKYGFYNEFLVTQHSILRELAISQSKSEEHHERERLNLEIREDTFPDWCLDLMQPISARLLSISTGNFFMFFFFFGKLNVEILINSLKR